MIKSAIAIVLMLSTSVFAQSAGDYRDETLPVICGPLTETLERAKEGFNEDPVVTWMDSRFGRYFLLSNPEGTSISLVLVLSTIDDIACVISVGDGLMIKPLPSPKATL